MFLIIGDDILSALFLTLNRGQNDVVWAITVVFNLCLGPTQCGIEQGAGFQSQVRNFGVGMYL